MALLSRVDNADARDRRHPEGFTEDPASEGRRRAPEEAEEAAVPVDARARRKTRPAG